MNKQTKITLFLICMQTSLFATKETKLFEKVTSTQTEEINSCISILSKRENSVRICPLMNPKQIQKFINQATKTKSSSLWIQRNNAHQVVAFALCDHSQNNQKSSSTHIHAVAVDPEQKRQGFGKQLMLNLLANLKKLSPSITLTVEYNNEAAKKLYEKVGFISSPNKDKTFIAYSYGRKQIQKNPSAK